MKGASWMEIRSNRQKGLSYVELGEEVPHGPTDGKAVRGITAEAGVHTERAQGNEDGSIQTDSGRVAGGGAVLGNTDPGKAAGDGI